MLRILTFFCIVTLPLLVYSSEIRYPTPDNPKILLKSFDAKWRVTPDGPMVCVNVEIVDTSINMNEKSDLCWTIPRSLIHQMQTNYGEI